MVHHLGERQKRVVVVVRLYLLIQLDIDPLKQVLRKRKEANGAQFK